MAESQLDLFADDRAAAPRNDFVPTPEFVERVRRELAGTLALVRGAAGLPWADLTRTTLAELRFRSMSGWLPTSEAATLRAAFDAEMDRLYAIEDAKLEAEGLL
ncbi:MAG: hypothetical protein IT561_28105 [Alphaproteobacteria bacterium]|nr:hypothetical protein [Alphaproteobacteria bacterium]